MSELLDVRADVAHGFLPDVETVESAPFVSLLDASDRPSAAAGDADITPTPADRTAEVVSGSVGLQRLVLAATTTGESGLVHVSSDRISEMRIAGAEVLAAVGQAQGLENPHHLTAATHLHLAVAESRVAGGSRIRALGHVVRGMLALQNSVCEPLAEHPHRPASAALFVRAARLALSRTSAESHSDPEEPWRERLYTERVNTASALLNHGRTVHAQ